MEHAGVQAHLQAYLDGTLPPEEARAVHAHLDGCTECRAELALLREADEALRAWPVLPEPEGLAARVMAQIAAETAPAPRLWEAPLPWLRVHWSEVLLGAASVATLAVLVISLRAVRAQGAVELRFWDLQVQRALATLERVWYAARADAWRVRMGRGSTGRPGGAVIQLYCWVAGAVALLAGAASAGVLAQQWRRLRRS